VKVKVQSFAGTDAADIELNDEVFGLDPRADILHRVVTWQLEKRRATARGTRERADVARCLCVEGLYLDLHVQPSWPSVASGAAASSAGVSAGALLLLLAACLMLAGYGASA